MRNANTTFIIILSFLAIVGLAVAAKPKQMTANESRVKAMELLDKYAETQDKIKSFIVIYEKEVTGEGIRHGTYQKAKKHTTMEIRTDGKRFKHIVHHDPHSVPKDKPNKYDYYLYDGKYGFQYGMNFKEGHPSRLFLYPPEVLKVQIAKGRRIFDVSSSMVRDSMCYRGADNQRIDLYLKKFSTTITVPDKTERIGELECFVIEAKTKYGDYTLWIDPHHGYNIAKFLNITERGHRFLMRNKGGTFRPGNYLKKEERTYYLIQVTRFENIDGIWIPMEAQIESLINLRGDRYQTVKSSYRRTKFILNPDHDALSSFLPDDIENGTIVQVPAEGLDDYNKWQDGKVVDDKGRTFYEIYQSKKPVTKGNKNEKR